MNNLVKVNNHELTVKEWNGEKVVTFSDIDLVHERAKGTAKRNFNSNKKHFIEEIDYHVVTIENAKKYEIRTFKIPPRGITLLTETGYLMLVKSFTDDLAWKVQRTLINCYFKCKHEVDKPKLIEAEHKFVLKTYKGVPVMTIRDLTFLYNAPKETINYIAVTHNIGTMLEGKELENFKAENSTINMKYVSSLRVFNRSDVIKISCESGGLKLRCDDGKISEYFDRSTLDDYQRLRLLELATDIRNIASLRGYNTPYENMLNLVASKIYVDCGFMSEVTDDLSTHKAIGWNLIQPLNDFRSKVRKILV